VTINPQYRPGKSSSDYEWDYTFCAGNHLGNVSVVISDRKISITDGVDFDATEYSSSEILHAQDYYPFGMVMPKRSVGSGYRFGFQNQEIDNVLWSGLVSYKYRIEDPRLGRFFSVDPLEVKYPWNSVYALSDNRVIDGVELEGLECKEFNSESALEIYCSANPL